MGQVRRLLSFQVQEYRFHRYYLDILPVIARELVGYIHIENMGLAAGIGNDQRKNLLLARFRIHTESIELWS